MKNDVISPEFDENGRPLRRIRSFVRRQGRLTKGQQHAVRHGWDRSCRRLKKACTFYSHTFPLNIRLVNSSKVSWTIW